MKAATLRICLALSIGCIFACATQSKMAKPLTDFNAATADATSATTSGLTLVQSADQDEAVVNASKLTELKEGKLPEFFRPEDLLQRQLALQALNAYATTLKTLATTDKSADIQKSFDSLKTSVDSTATTISKLNAGATNPIPTGVVSGLVSLSSNLVIAYSVAERERGIEQALDKSDKTVGKICSLLASELEQHGAIYDQLQNSYRVQEEATEDNFNSLFKPAGTPDPSKPTPTPKPSDLAPIVKTFVTLRTKKENTLALLNSLALVYRKIAKAHTALKLQSQGGPKAV